MSTAVGLAAGATSLLALVAWEELIARGLAWTAGNVVAGMAERRRRRRAYRSQAMPDRYARLGWRRREA